MWQFSQAVDGIAEASTALGTPITGGNVSFYNETLGKSIYPTPVIGMLGILDNPARVLQIAFRNADDVIVLLDGANTDTVAQGDSPAAFSREFSSSEYSKTLGALVAGEPPAVDLAAEKRLVDCLVALASEGVLESAHDISDGGLAVTLAESCFEHALFSERGARAIVSVSPDGLAAVLAIARQYGVAAREIGKVTRKGVFRIELKGRTVIDSPVEALADAWANSLERALVKG